MESLVLFEWIHWQKMIAFDNFQKKTDDIFCFTIYVWLVSMYPCLILNKKKDKIMYNLKFIHTFNKYLNYQSKFTMKFFCFKFKKSCFFLNWIIVAKKSSMKTFIITHEYLCLYFSSFLTLYRSILILFFLFIIPLLLYITI